MSKKSEAYIMELVARSLDTIRVINPTDKDFILWYNKSGADNIPPRKEVIPNKNKDIGFGKGKLELPRYLANMYRDKMIVAIINEQREVWWEATRSKYRPEEYEKIEQRYAPKTNDEKLIVKIMKTVIDGLVRKYEIPVDTETEDMTDTVKGDNKFDRIANQLGLSDKIIEQNKEEFLNAIQD